MGFMSLIFLILTQSLSLFNNTFVTHGLSGRGVYGGLLCSLRCLQRLQLSGVLPYLVLKVEPELPGLDASDFAS